MMKKTLFTKIASMILALLMMVSMIVAVPFSSSAETVANPNWLSENFDGDKTYTIDDAADLLAFKAALATKDFAGETVKLTADIDMSGIGSWTIANDTFSGTLDGQKHSIKNLNTTTGVQFGGVLFGTLNGATVQNLSLIDGVNSGLDNYGALIAGQTSGENTIRNLYVNNAISSGKTNLGGLIALGSATITFENCVVASTVDNSAYTGRSGAISGFIGRIKGATKIEYSNCAFIGSVVAGSQSWAGAFCGVNEHTQFTSSVNYNIVVAENAASMGTVTAVLSSQSADEADEVKYVTEATFAETLAAYGEAWIRTGETEMMPKIVAEMVGARYVVATPDWLTANFDGDKTYTIDDAADLLAFKAALATKDFAGETVKLTADIDMSGIGSWTIAADTFSGTLDGQKHSIKNLNTTTGVQFGGVLFGTLNGATVQDLSLIDGVNSGIGNYGALIAGQTSGENTIRNLYVNNAISGGAVNLGGLIGLGSATITFENCVVASTVDNSAYTGRSGAISGFIGRIKGATKIAFTNCAFIGSVVAGSQSWAGAFCGVNEHTQFTSSVNYDIVVAENAASLGTVTAVLSSQSANEADEVKFVTEATFAETLVAFGEAWIRTGETEMLPKTVAEMIGKEEYNPADKFIPANLYYQRATSLNADGTIDVRFVATIDKLDYAEVGFNITVTRTANGTSETSAKVPFVTTTVYKSIYALGETVTAEELEGAYIVAIVITGIDCENYAHSIDVEAFVKDTAQSDATITASGTVTLAQTVAA